LLYTGLDRVTLAREVYDGRSNKFDLIDPNPNPGTDNADTAEHSRLDEARTGKAAWKKWGPYLSERQWGTEGARWYRPDCVQSRIAASCPVEAASGAGLL